MAGKKGTIETILLELANALSVIKDSLAGNLLRELGINLPLFIEEDTQFTNAYTNVSASLNELPGLSTELKQAIENEDVIKIAEKVEELAEKVKELVERFQDFATILRTKAATLSSPDKEELESFAERLPGKLIHYCIVTYLEKRSKLPMHALNFLGVLDWKKHTEFGETELALPFIERSLHPERITKLISDPVAAIKDKYGWGEDTFDTATLFNVVKNIIEETTGGIADIVNIGSEETLLETYLFSLQRNITTTPPSLNFILSVPFEEPINFSEETDLVFPWKQKITITGQASADIVGKIEPPFDLSLSMPGQNLAASLAAEFFTGQLTEPFILIGLSSGSRIEAKNLSIKVSADASTNGTDNSFNSSVEFMLTGLECIIDFSGSDGFVKNTVNTNQMAANVDVSATWSVNGGLNFGVSGGLQLAMPVHKTIGPATLQQIYLAFSAADAPSIDTKAAIKVTIGPVTAVIDEIGLRTSIGFAENNNGNFGPLQIDVGFLAPKGIGLSVDAGGIKGGGILKFDSDNHEYFGGLELDFKNLFALKAFAIINTRLPDGSEGFSMLIIITAEFNPIQLGFGFNLVGVGGLLGINRTAKVEVLKEGVKTGTLESILFSKDIVANINRIVSDIKQVFPPQENHFLICPMGKIGWGTPPIITLELGILIEIPATRLIILGILRALLPEEKKPVLKLQVNFLGIIDFENKSISFDASLYDSKILTFTLTGDMALRLNFGDNPSFLLSVGGFHPAFKEIPPDLQSMRRITISLYNSSDTRITIQTYFAVTSNTAQFGARAELFAEKGSFNIYGFVGYDVLFQFSPFKFIASLAAGVALRRNTSVIMSIDVSGELSGPTPWDAHGKASISFFFFSVSVPFHAQWGDPNTEGEKEKADILLLLSDAIQDSSNWKAGIPANNKLHVSIKDTTAEPDPVIHPFGVLTFSERIVPLDLDITKFGNQLPKDAKKFTIAAVGDFNGDDVKEPFAPASFFTMDDHEKLIRPSFEKLKSGFKITGTNQLKAPEHIANKQVSYEFSYLGETKKRVKDKFQYPGLFFTAHSKNSAAAQSSLSGINNKDSLNAPKKVNVLDDQYVLANVSDMKQFDIEQKAASYTEALQQYQNIIRTRPELKDQLQVLSAYELN